MNRFLGFTALSLAVAAVALPLAVSAAGTADRTVIRVAQAATPAAPAAGGAAADPMAIGATVYADMCAGCHAANGRGDIGPSLVGNGKLANAPAVHRQIAQGGSEMPGFGSVLTPEELLAVGTYVRMSWGNDYGPLTEENIVAQ